MCHCVTKCRIDGVPGSAQELYPVTKCCGARLAELLSPLSSSQGTWISIRRWRNWWPGSWAWSLRWPLAWASPPIPWTFLHLLERYGKGSFLLAAWHFCPCIAFLSAWVAIWEYSLTVATVRVKSMLLYVYKCRWPLSNNNWQFNVNIFLSLWFCLFVFFLTILLSQCHTKPLAHVLWH